MTTRSRHALTILAAVGGIVLFGYAVRRAGVAEIVDGVRVVGWGFLIILGLAGVRFLIRACTWRLCMPQHRRLSLPQSFSAFLAGDAIGNLTPLGMVASEPTKVFLTRHRLATREAVASLATDNLLYTASIAVMVGLGVVVALMTVPLSVAWRDGAIAALVVAALGSLITLRLLRGTWREESGARPPWRETLSGLRQSVVAFALENPARLVQILLLDLSFHVLAVFEVFLTLRWLLGDRSPTLEQAIVFEALNRVVTVAFKFVPFRVGIDEALSGALAPVMAVNAAAGVTLAVVRKVRNLVWTGVGLALIAGHPAHAEPGTDRRENAPAHRT
jgi:glycosyltransferase 2 family protein